MTAIEVQRLKVPGKAEARERTRFAIEDGLRTSIPDETRLVLIRRMEVKGDIVSTHPARRDEALREGWLRAITGARHGSEDGAPGANCVWFASREEVESLLLERLLAGLSVDAWYWKLALPAWRGRPLRWWLPECLAAALRESSPERLARIAQSCILAGATEILLDALGQSGEVPGEPAFSAAAAIEASEDAGVETPAVAAITAPFVARLARSISPLVRRAILRLSRQGPEARSAAIAIVKTLLIRTSPAIALSPRLLRSISSQAIEMISLRSGPRTPLPVEPSIAQMRVEPDGPAVGPVPSLPLVPLSPTRPLVHERRDANPDNVDATEPRSPDALPEPIASPRWERLASAHAGLWLIVPSLIDLGFREWLLERPHLLANNPGRQVFEEVAAHYRVKLDDPALAVFEGPSHPAAAADWPRLWRCGLDGWLRRVARRRLHDLLSREGLLELGDRQLLVHFPAGAADLRLRRRALDRDPGWTDWLGVSIRYRFGGVENRP